MQACRTCGVKQNRLPGRVVSSMRDSQTCGVTHAGQVALSIYSMLGVKHVGPQDV